MRVEVRAIKESEREECVNLWCTVWPGETAENYFRRYFYGDVEWLPYYTQVAIVDGRLVSAVQICKRTVACGDFLLTMGGIANVATLPEYRGQGYNSLCLHSAIAVMEADAMDFSLLFTGIQDYYARFGYAILPRTQLYGTIRPDFVPRSTPLTVRQANAEDLPAIRALYDSYNRKRPIAVQRYEAYWRDWMNIEPDKLPALLFVAINPQGAICGYANCGTFRSAKPYAADEVQVRIMELGTNEESESETTAVLLEASAARFQAEGATVLRLDIAPEPAVLNALKTILSATETSSSSSGMVRLLHRENLLRSLTIGLNERWIAAGRPTGALVFETPYGTVGLDANGTFLRVLSEIEADRVLSQSALFGLLFGSLRPEQATSDTELYPLLTALFPPQAAVYWGADGF